MRKKIAVIGLVLLVAGVAIFFAGGSLGIRGLINDETMSAKGSGEFMSPVFNVSSGELVLITSNPASSIYLIPSADASIVNSSNVGNYKVAGGTYANNSGVTTIEYTSISSGTYNIVSFTSSSPKVTLTKEPVNSLLVALLPTIIGGIMAFAGFIVLIIGLVLRRKEPPMPDLNY